MDFARLRPRVAVLLTSGALALAALMAGGCSAPDSDERAQFVSVTGVVVNAATNAVIPGSQGARAYVVPPLAVPPTSANSPIGTRGFNGQIDPSTGLIGPFPVDEAGRFVIPAVPASPSLANPTVLNIKVFAPGFIPGVATEAAPQSTTILQRTFTAGVQTSDIVVTASGVNDAVARLQPLGGAAGAQNTGTIGVAGGSISAGSATLTVPAGALTTPTSITVTGLGANSLAGFAAAPPATTGATSAPALVTVGSSNVPATIPLGGLNVGGDVTSFPAGVTGTISSALISGISGLSSGVRVVRFNPITGLWELVTATPTIVGGNVTFPVSGPGTYALVINATWTIGTPQPTGRTVELPPIKELPGGYTVIGPRMTQDISFSDPVLAELLAASYSALTGDFATLTPSPVVDVVPPGTTIGRICAENRISIQVTTQIVGHENVTGVRTTWLCRDKTFAAPVVGIPAHLQGHIQGGGTGF